MHGAGEEPKELNQSMGDTLRAVGEHIFHVGTELVYVGAQIVWRNRRLGLPSRRGAIFWYLTTRFSLELQRCHVIFKVLSRESFTANHENDFARTIT